MVALLFVGSAISLLSCKEEQKAEEGSLDAIMTEQSEHLTIVVTENGRKSYRFTTPLLEGYTLGRDPYREFRKGIHITTYQDDSMTTVNATLEANYAIYYENRKLWEAKGNVRVNKFDGTKLYTQQLFWDSTTKRIYSNVDTKVVTETDTHFCEGFDSDEDLIELKFRRWKGKMLMEEDMLSPKDSLAGDESAEEQPPVQASGTLRERKRPSDSNPALGSKPKGDQSSVKSDSANEDASSDKAELRRPEMVRPADSGRFPSENGSQRPRPRIVSKPQSAQPLTGKSVVESEPMRAKPAGEMSLNGALATPTTPQAEPSDTQTE